MKVKPGDTLLKAGVVRARTGDFFWRAKSPVLHIDQVPPAPVAMPPGVAINGPFETEAEAIADLEAFVEGCARAFAVTIEVE
jgi:hypothetical protein